MRKLKLSITGSELYSLDNVVRHLIQCHPPRDLQQNAYDFAIISSVVEVFLKVSKNMQEAYFMRAKTDAKFRLTLTQAQALALYVVLAMEWREQPAVLEQYNETSFEYVLLRKLVDTINREYLI